MKTIEKTVAPTLLNLWLKGSALLLFIATLVVPAWADPPCLNLAGGWTVTEDVTLRITILGQSETTSQSGTVHITMYQSGATVWYYEEITDPDTGDTATVKREGTIQGDTVTFSGIAALPIQGVSYSQNSMVAVGKIQGGRINATSTVQVAGTGYVDGMFVSGTVTGGGTAVFVPDIAKWPPGTTALIAPGNNASIIQARPPQLVWSNSVPAATWFHLYVTRNQSAYVDQWIEGATNWQPGIDMPSGSYSWWVQTWNPDGYGSWSTSSTFTFQRPHVGKLTLLSPSGAFDTSTNARYTWGADTNASWYELYVSRNGSLFADKWYALSNSVLDSATGNFAVDMSGHTGGSYQWYVRGWNPEGFGPWSGPMSFSLGIPGAVALLTPTNNASLSDRHPELSWSQSFPAASWFQLSVTRNGSTYLDQWIEGKTNWTPAADLPAGSYSWRVQTYSSGGLGAWSTNSTFTILSAVPAKMVLVSPTGSMAVNTTQRYTWKTDTNATWYELCVTRNGSVFADKWFALSNSVVDSATGNFAVDVGGHVGGSYQWYVRGWSPDGLGAWSDPLGFTLGVAGPVTLLTPTNNASLQERQPRFSWSQSFPTADWFRLYITHNGSPYLDQWIEGATNYTPAITLPWGNYTWWVQTYNSTGLGAWSTNATFTVPRAVPTDILLVSPTGSVAAGSTQRYTWKADPAAIWYELYVTRNGSVFADKWFAVSNSVVDSVTGNFAVDVSGHGSGTYQWWVRGWSPDGLGPWSVAGNFTVPSLMPGVLTLLSPTGNITAASTVSYSWTADVKAAWYELYVTQNGSVFADKWYAVSNSTTVEFTVDLSGHGGGSYQWWVRGWSPDGLGPWSATGSFSIPIYAPATLAGTTWYMMEDWAQTGNYRILSLAQTTFGVVERNGHTGSGSYSYSKLGAAEGAITLYWTGTQKEYIQMFFNSASDGRTMRWYTDESGNWLPGNYLGDFERR